MSKHNTVNSKYGETIKLYNVRRDDAGEIMCIANNSYPPIISRQFQLRVQCKYLLLEYKNEKIIKMIENQLDG